MTKKWLLGLILSWIISPVSFALDGKMTLAEDCFNEWKSRGWVIGEDSTPAVEVPKFAEGIKKVCGVRSRLYEEDPTVSPYIQARLPELAPYLFAGDEKAIETLIRKLQTRRPGPAYSGAFMRD